MMNRSSSRSRGGALSLLSRSLQSQSQNQNQYSNYSIRAPLSDVNRNNQGLGAAPVETKSGGIGSKMRYKLRSPNGISMARSSSNISGGGNNHSGIQVTQSFDPFEDPEDEETFSVRSQRSRSQSRSRSAGRMDRSGNPGRSHSQGRNALNTSTRSSGSNVNSISLNQSVRDMKDTRSDSQQKRLEWAKKRGELVASQGQGDIMRVNPNMNSFSSGASVSTNSRAGNGNGHFRTSPRSSPRTSPIMDSVPNWIGGGNDNGNGSGNADSAVNTSSSKSVNTTMTLTKEQLKHMMQEKISQTHAHLKSQYENQIFQQQKQIDEMKFFQELHDDGGNGGNNNTSTTAKGGIHSPSTPAAAATKDANNNQQQLQQQQIQTLTSQLAAFQSQIRSTQAENTRLNHQISECKSEMLHLQASLQAAQHAANPNDPNTLSSTDAYKKALKAQSELHEARTLLQEETLSRERAETNLNCFKMESMKQQKEYDDKIQGLEKLLEDKFKDLDDGVMIMKGLEEELIQVNAQLNDTKEKRKKDRGKFQDFEKEKNELAEKLSAELEKSKEHVSKLEERFQKEKETLEQKCTDCEQEVKEMKERVEEMHNKRKEHEEIKKRLEESEKELEKLKTQKTDKEKDLEELLIQAREDAKESTKLQDKIAAMEQVVAMYHEKARGEIKEFARAAEEANEQEAMAREELQECLVQLENAEEDMNAMVKEMQDMKLELEEREEQLREMDRMNAANAENAKSLTAAKAKEHQHMRERKKWVTTEKSLREELDEVQREHEAMHEEYDIVRHESDELNEAFSKLEEENDYLSKQVKSMKSELKKYSMALETNEKESRRRIQSLEKELVRTRNSNHGMGIDGHESGHYGHDHEDLVKMKSLSRKKDDETRQAQEMAKAAVEEMQQLKRQMINMSTSASVSSSSQYNHGHSRSRSSPTFHEPKDLNMSSRSRSHHYHTKDRDLYDDDVDDEEVKRYTSNATISRSKTPTSASISMSWDEMDNPNLATTPGNSANSIRSINSKGSSNRAKSVTPDSTSVNERERRTIENDAIRTYMRQRRRKNMQ